MSTRDWLSSFYLELTIFLAIIAVLVGIAFLPYRPPRLPPPAPITAEYLADSVVGREAFEARLPIHLMLAIRRVENPRADTLAVSRAGAIGLMQVMPAWDSAFVVECGRGPSTNPDRNACVGARIFRRYLDREMGDVPRALCRYNGAHRLPRACAEYKDAVLRELAR